VSRGARLLVGLSVTGLLVLLTLVALVVGGAARMGTTPPAGPFAELDPADLPARADAEVLDVDVDSGWTTLDVRFDSGQEVVVTWVDWTVDAPTPRLGQLVPVAFDPYDPEYTSVLDTGLLDVAPQPDAGPLPDAGAGQVGTETAAVVARAAFWAAGVAALLAVACGIGTGLWVRRAPDRVRPVAPAGAWQAYGGLPPGGVARSGP
jgi:hypothetical protein